MGGERAHPALAQAACGPSSLPETQGYFPPVTVAESGVEVPSGGGWSGAERTDPPCTAREGAGQPAPQIHRGSFGSADTMPCPRGQVRIKRPPHDQGLRMQEPRRGLGLPLLSAPPGPTGETPLSPRPALRVSEPSPPPVPFPQPASPRGAACRPNPRPPRKGPLSYSPGPPETMTPARQGLPRRSPPRARGGRAEARLVEQACAPAGSCPWC